MSFNRLIQFITIGGMASFFIGCSTQNPTAFQNDNPSNATTDAAQSFKIVNDNSLTQPASLTPDMDFASKAKTTLPSKRLFLWSDSFEPPQDNPGNLPVGWDGGVIYKDDNTGHQFLMANGPCFVTDAVPPDSIKIVALFRTSFSSSDRILRGIGVCGREYNGEYYAAIATPANNTFGIYYCNNSSSRQSLVEVNCTGLQPNTNYNVLLCFIGKKINAYLRTESGAELAFCNYICPNMTSGRAGICQDNNLSYCDNFYIDMLIY
jgi:hypothetical protein